MAVRRPRARRRPRRRRGASRNSSASGSSARSFSASPAIRRWLITQSTPPASVSSRLSGSLSAARVELAARPQQRREALQRASWRAAASGPGGRRLDQAGARHARMLGGDLQQRPQPGPHLVRPGPVFAVVGFLDHVGGALDRRVEQRQEGLLLVGVVLVEGRVADPGAAHDLLDRRLRVALLGDQVRGRLEDPPALVVRGRGAADRLGAGRLPGGLSRQCAHGVRIARVPIGTKAVYEVLTSSQRWAKVPRVDAPPTLRAVRSWDEAIPRARVGRGSAGSDAAQRRRPGLRQGHGAGSAGAQRHLPRPLPAALRRQGGLLRAGLRDGGGQTLRGSARGGP